MMVQSNYLKKRGMAAYEEDEEEAVYFDQTSKHIGSISKNMLFSHKEDGMISSRAKMSQGLTETGTMVNYTLEANANQLATYMVDIKGQAQQHNMKFGKGRRNDSNDVIDEHGGARAGSHGMNGERQNSDI